MRVAVALAWAALAGCTCKQAVVAKDGGTPPFTLSPSTGLSAGSAEGSASEPIFNDDPQHPWNRVHAALFSRQRSIGVAPCALTDAGCLELSVGDLHRTPFVSQALREGGDEPLAFIGGEVDFLATAKRRDAALAAIAAAMAVAPSTDRVAAALLQNDLWERSDALADALAEPATPGRELLAPLRAPLAKLIAHLAQPEATLHALPGNFDALGRAFPEQLPGWGGPDWVEIRSEFTDDPTDDWRFGTRHAERWGHRAAFRVFARATDSAWLRAHLDPSNPLPEGTRLALVGAPLGISSEGTIVPLPLVMVVELRTSRGEAPAPNLGALKFEVLEGKRALLRKSPMPSGGAVRLGPETLLPIGATCMPDRSSREPLKGACTMCHGAGATRLTGPLMHGKLRLVEEKDPEAAGREVARVKTATAAFGALRAAAWP